MASDPPETVSLYQQKEQESLSPDSRFTFHCHAGLPCFNQCCQTPTVILSPYDLLRLKQALGITSGQVLERYTRQEIEPNANLPLVFIDALPVCGGGLPFPRGAGLHGLSPSPGGLPPLSPHHGQPAHPGRRRGPFFLPPPGLLPGIRHRGRMDGGLLDGRPGICRV